MLPAARTNSHAPRQVKLHQCGSSRQTSMCVASVGAFAVSVAANHASASSASPVLVLVRVQVRPRRALVRTRTHTSSSCFSMAVVAVQFILYLVRFCSPKPCSSSCNHDESLTRRLLVLVQVMHSNARHVALRHGSRQQAARSSGRSSCDVPYSYNRTSSSRRGVVLRHCPMIAAPVVQHKAS